VIRIRNHADEGFLLNQITEEQNAIQLVSATKLDALVISGVLGLRLVGLAIDGHLVESH